jgi:hypothetical protein
MANLELLLNSKFNAQGVIEAEKKMKATFQGFDKFLEKVGGGGTQLTPVEQSLIKMRQEIQRLGGDWKAATELVKRYRDAAAGASSKAFSQGGLEEAQMQAKVADEAQRMLKVQERMANGFEKVNKQSNISKTIWARMAFRLFVLQGAIGTVVQALNKMITALEQAAARTDRLRAFSSAMEIAGINASGLANRMREASQGAITLDEAIKPVLLLMKSGLSEAAAQSDELLKIATNAAIVSGDLGQLDRIYGTLVEGIVRGSPKLIDNAGIVLKLGAAYDAYAASLGKSADELTVTEQKMATLQAVLAEGNRMEELAEDVDSTALAFAQLKTEAKTSWQAGLSVLAEGIVNMISAWTKFKQNIKIVTSFITLFTTKLQRVAIFGEKTRDEVEQIFADNPIRAWAETIIMNLLVVRETFEAFVKNVKELGGALSDFWAKQTADFQDFKRVMQGEITFDQLFDNIDARSAELEGKFSDIFDIDAMEINARASEELRKLFPDSLIAAPEELAENVDKAKKEMEELIRLENQLQGLSNALADAIEARTGIDAQAAKKRADIEEDLADSIADINKDLNDRLIDLNEDLAQRISDIRSKYREDLAEENSDYADELREINEDLAEDLANSTEESAKARTAAEKKRTSDIEKAETDHKKKLLDIERKYQASRLSAIIDRDARALFEAEQARANDIANLEDATKEKREEAEDNFKEELEQIVEQEEEKRKEAIKAAEKARADARKAHAEKLADLKRENAKQLAEARKNHAEQRAEAIEAAREQRMDAQSSYRDAMQDLKEWYHEQMLMQKERHLQEAISEAEHLAKQGELTQAHIDNLKGMWSDYNKFVSGGNTSGVGGGGSGSVGGFGGSGSSGGSSGGTIGSLGGRFSGNSNGSTSTYTLDDFFAGRGLNLNINSNDRMLEDILKSSVYSATLDVMGD